MRLRLLIMLVALLTQTPTVADPCPWTMEPCWVLKPTSPYKNAGTDGRDLGANGALIDSMTACVISGDPRIPACQEYERLRLLYYESPQPPRNLRIIRD